MNVKEVLGAFLLVNNPIVLSEEETKDVQKAIKQLQQENKILKENAENNDKVVDKVNWENMLLKKENEQLKAEYGTKAQVERDLLKEENEKLKAELQLYQGALKREHEAIHRVNDLEEVIDKAIKLIEDTYYSKNTTDIDSIVLSNDKLLIIREILKEVSE